MFLKMKTKTIVFTTQELKDIKALIKEHDELYDIETWDFENLEYLQQIGYETINIIREKIENI
jgi:hypothetical protein